MDHRSPEQQARLQTSEREQEIRTILAKDKESFTNWLAHAPKQPSLDLPPEAARYLIPERLFQFTDHPHSLQVRIMHNSPVLLSMFVVEEMQEPVTNAASLTDYQKALSESIKSGGQLPRPEVPTDVDPKHALYRNMLDQSGIAMNDKIILHTHMTQFGNDELFMDSYDDRPGYRNKGIATDFYKRLREIARTMNEYYIVGSNREGSAGELGSIDFFVNKQGRVRFSELTGRYKDAFWKRHAPYSFKPEDADYWTIDFLDPLERALAISIENK
jgi:hypothetical protein